LRSFTAANAPPVLGGKLKNALRQSNPECGYRSVSVAGLPFSASGIASGDELYRDVKR
jgi:hypothetical protein